MTMWIIVALVLFALAGVGWWWWHVRWRRQQMTRRELRRRRHIEQQQAWDAEVADWVRRRLSDRDDPRN